MDKIVDFNHDRYIRFIAEPVWLDWIKLKNKEEIEKKQVMVICLKDLRTDCKVVHPISEFVLQWYNKQFNTMRKHTITTVAFLNFILDRQNDFKVSTLEDLTLSHANEFLNHLTANSRAYGTVKDAEQTLTQLYLFLYKHEILKHVQDNAFEKHTGPYHTYIKSPFTPIYPSIKARKIEHILPYQYIGMFLESVITTANPILLGVYFQIFGGLRAGEVVNIKRSDVKVKPTGEILISLNNNNLRTDIRTGDASVKRPRQQRIMSIHDWLSLFKENHYKLYIPTDGSNALFINRDGKAMSLGSYRQYFEKAKTHFIKRLRESHYKDDVLLGNHLYTAKWSTHIGRGTFTNLLAEEAENPYDIAQPRGDKQLTSSLSYMSGTERMKRKIEEKLQNMTTNYLPMLIQQRKRN
ncbi:hypothetical protein [Paenibacillus vini]|uniref:Core-binding (CB) domain-containing protein n=1 Tax=Paenibacillus vini TaxID=1476024 RepID=A0ABQ4MH36_9BACL|nr:hypothetical protein [Paenibacillus vini]GIP55306.1 hypothetical protein J42TS3_43410 [Paenibacillus vini]